MKAWITKYALSSGIQEREVKRTFNNEKGIEAVSFPGEYGMVLFLKPDWYSTKEEAVKRAEDMRLKKIQSLNKQLKKMEELRFE